MSEGIIRHMYPGGNTPGGFFSYYPYIIDLKTARRIFVLKGGPGTGKSTFMRKIGIEFSKQGYEVEFMHCSSDNNSLDGVVIPKLSVALIDGTAPHVVDPVYPGAVDEIINLGQFWNEAGFSDSRTDIIEISERIRGHFSRAYRYLRAASSLKEDTEKIFQEALDAGRQSQFTKELVHMILGEGCASETPGRQRCLFASAITPRGFSDFLDSICSTEKIIRLSSTAGSATGDILEAIKNEAIIRGWHIETFFCPMSPTKLEHLVIPDLSVSVFTANEYHDISNINNDKCTTYSINEFYNNEKLEYYSKQLGFNRLYTETLFQRAIECISEAKQDHDELEKHYIKNMDFDRITEFREELTKRIISIA